MKEFIQKEPKKVGVVMIVIGCILIPILLFSIKWHSSRDFMTNISRSSVYSVKHSCVTRQGYLGNIERCQFTDITFKHLIWIPIGLIGFGSYLLVLSPTQRKDSLEEDQDNEEEK